MALAYTAPTWQNGGGVGISASQLQALSDCMEGLVQGSDKAITNISISGQTITLTFADGSVETGTASGLKGILGKLIFKDMCMLVTSGPGLNSFLNQHKLWDVHPH